MFASYKCLSSNPIAIGATIVNSYEAVIQAKGLCLVVVFSS